MKCTQWYLFFDSFTVTPVTVTVPEPSWRCPLCLKLTTVLTALKSFATHLTSILANL